MVLTATGKAAHEMARFHLIHSAWAYCRYSRLAQISVRWLLVAVLVGFVIVQQARHQRQLADTEMVARTCTAVAERQHKMLLWFLSDETEAP